MDGGSHAGWRVEVTEWVFMTVKVLDHAFFPAYCKYPLIA